MKETTSKCISYLHYVIWALLCAASKNVLPTGCGGGVWDVVHRREPWTVEGKSWIRAIARSPSGGVEWAQISLVLSFRDAN